MSDSELETITLGGGCFWCVEAVLEQLRGVREVMPGYAGGHVANPSYREVCGKQTGHAEVVQVQFDASEIPLRDLLEVFMTTHDPTTRNRQGADVGPQYRSIILYHSPQQEEIARQVIADLDSRGVWSAPIVTELKPLEAFYPAEPEHREYYRRNPEQMYCAAVIAPKLAKLRRLYMDRLGP